MGRAQAAFLWDKELTKAGFPRVLVVSTHEQPRQDDKQQGRQKCDELHKTGRILGVSEAVLSCHQNTRAVTQEDSEYTFLPQSQAAICPLQFQQNTVPHQLDLQQALISPAYPLVLRQLLWQSAALAGY